MLAGSMDNSGRLYYAIDQHDAEIISLPGGGSVQPNAFVAYERALESLDTILNNAFYEPDPQNPGKERVKVVLSEGAKPALEVLLNATAETVYVPVSGPDLFYDWAGRIIRPGNRVSEMYIALVSNTTAYGDFSANEVVLQDTFPTTVVVAVNLPSSVAANLVGAIGF
jgi:hypothetical protein